MFSTKKKSLREYISEYRHIPLVFSDKGNIVLDYSEYDGRFFIRREQHRKSLFSPSDSSDKGIWSEYHSFRTEDAVYLLQLFNRALRHREKNHELAAFIEKNFLLYLRLAETLLSKEPAERTIHNYV